MIHSVAFPGEEPTMHEPMEALTPNATVFDKLKSVVDFIAIKLRNSGSFLAATFTCSGFAQSSSDKYNHLVH
jgi:hypothetical protein